MSSRRINDIETLSEWLGSLQITEEASSDYERSDIKMSVALAPAAINKNVQAEIPKNIVLDPGWFDGGWTKFKD